MGVTLLASVVPEGTEGGRVGRELGRCGTEPGCGPRGWLWRGFPREAERSGAAGGGRASAGVTGEEEKWAEKSEWTRGGRESGSRRRRRLRAGAAPLPRGTPPARLPRPPPERPGRGSAPSPNSNPALLPLPADFPSPPLLRSRSLSASACPFRVLPSSWEFYLLSPPSNPRHHDLLPLRLLSI